MYRFYNVIYWDVVYTAQDRKWRDTGKMHEGIKFVFENGCVIS